MHVQAPDFGSSSTKEGSDSEQDDPFTPWQSQKWKYDDDDDGGGDSQTLHP